MADLVAQTTEGDASGQTRMEFLLGMRAVPGAIAIIAAASGDSMTGMAATAWNSVSADPPMLLVCVNKGASVHEIIQRAAAFSVNLVPAEAQELVAIFSAQRGLHGADRFLDGHWASGSQGQPLLESAVASFECELVAEHVHGTHSIFIGKVGTVRRNADTQALIYLDGAFARPEILPRPVA